MNWKTEYIEKIDCVNSDDLQIEAAQRLKIKNLPMFLYKYRAASEEAIGNLESDTVWLSRPSKYYDPFEFAEYFDFDRYSKAVIVQNKEEFI